MGNFTDDKIKAVWEKAKSIDGYDADKYRQDLAGAWIQKDKYGQAEVFGWEIDHQFPSSLGGNDCTENLQPLHWENNRKKADNFPKFQTAISSKSENNVAKEQNWYYEDISFFQKLYPENNFLQNIIKKGDKL